jgi:hypothetical protein
MADSLKELFVVLKANTDDFVAKMNDADKKLGTWQKSVDKAGKNLQQLGQKMFLAGTAIVGGLGVMVDSYAKTGEEIEQMKAKTGMGAEALSELKYVLDQVGGTFTNLPASIKAMNLAISSAATGMDPFNKAMADAAASGKKEHVALAQTATQAAWAKTAFGQLGISLEALKAMTPEEQFNTLTTALSGVTDESTQATLAQAVFGKGSTDLLPLIETEKGKVTELKDEAHALNVTFTDESAAAAGAFEEAKGKLTASFDGLKASIADSLMPTLGDLFERFSNIITKVADWSKANPDLAKTLLEIGAVLVVGGAILMGLSMLSKAIIAINSALVIMKALSGPSGWATLAAGIAIAGASILAVNKLMGSTGSVEQASNDALNKLNSEYLAGKITAQQYGDRYDVLNPVSTKPKGYAFGGIIPGPIGAPVPIIAHGGEQFLGKAGGSAGGVININVGNLMGDEVSLRSFARKVNGYIGENQRRNSFGHINRGYFSGTSSL